MQRKQKERPLRRGNIVWVRRKRQDGGTEEAKGRSFLYTRNGGFMWWMSCCRLRGCGLER